jgi:hypothetical protein
MSITQNNQDIKIEQGMDLVPPGGTKSRVLTTLVAIVLVGIGYILGQISREAEEKPVVVVKHERAREVEVKNAVSASVGMSLASKSPGPTTTPLYNGVVASRTGKKYHFPWCAGARSIKESNKIWFISEQEARKAGYEPATNCKGLQ